MATPSDENRQADTPPGDDPNDPPFLGGSDTSRGADGSATLDLQDLDERLPWLESDDDLEQPEGAGGRIFVAVLGGLIALAAIVGGIWWVSHRADDSEAIADGGVIKAPDQPYKEAPANPGGKTFAGTGDSSFAVSEGQARPARLGQESPTVKPSPSPTPSASASAAAQGGVGVQVGAYSNRTTAEAGWTKLQQQHEALSGVPHRVVEGQADIGTVYRLQAVAGDLAAANALCGRLKASGVACQVKR